MGADRSGDPDFETYLREIRRYDLLDPQAERDLAREIQQDPWAWEARDRMIRANLRLVVALAKRYRNRGLPLADLVEEGNIGLVHAVAKFDPDMETRFSTYATWWIRQAIRRSIQSKSRTVRVPAYMAEELHRWRRQARAFEQRHGRPPSDEELVKAMRPAPARCRFLLRLYHALEAGSETVSFDTLFESGDNLPDHRAVRPDLLEFGLSDRQRALDLIDTLPPREAEILRLRFGLGENETDATLRQTAVRMGLSRERVRQLEKQAIAALRSALGVTAVPVRVNGRATGKGGGRVSTRHGR